MASTKLSLFFGGRRGNEYNDRTLKVIPPKLGKGVSNKK